MFANDSYAKVWKIQPKEKQEQKYTVVQLSTSKKNKSTNQYETDFSGFVRFIGDAEKKIGNLEANDRVKLLKVGVTNKYDKESRKTNVNYLCFDFEQDEKKAKASSDEWVKMDDIPDSELPFAN